MCVNTTWNMGYHKPWFRSHVFYVGVTHLARMSSFPRLLHVCNWLYIFISDWMLSCFRHQQVKNRERWLRHVIFWGIERGNWQWDRRETKLPTRSACREGQWNESSRISKFVTVSCFGDCFFLAMYSQSYCFRCGLPVGPHFFIFCMHVLVALLLFSIIFKFNVEDKLYFLSKFVVCPTSQ